MTRVWFNRTFSNVRAVLDLIRRGDAAGEFHLVCTHPQATFPGFGAAHESALEPAGPSGSDYVDFCLDFCRERRIDYIWPGKEARLLAEQRARFAAEGVRVLSVASPDTLDLLHDKARFHAQARHFPIPTPATLECRTAEEFETAYARLRTDHAVLCVKPAKGVNGAGFRVIEESRPGLESLLQGALYSISLEGLRQLLRETPSFPPLLVMEFLDGAEYSLDAVGDGRRLVALTQRRKATDGGYGQRIVALPALTQAVAGLIKTFALTGLFNAQFREGRNGLRLLEINPRFAGGIGYTGAAGLNLPYLALHGLIHGFPDAATPQVATSGRVLEVARYERGEEIALSEYLARLQTGTLRARVRESALPLEELCGFAARNNRKRGFLFLSKVLGKHWPATPARMRWVHEHLAAQLQLGAGPWLFIAMAETATGLGQGVFEAALEGHPQAEALFVHSTRYRIDGRPLLDFQEPHCHAPDQLLYMPLRPQWLARFQGARELILVDDEISTGTTLCNLVDAYRRLNPGIEHVHFVSITNFSGADSAARFSARLGLPVDCVAALHGDFDFQPTDAPPLAETPVAVGDNRREPDQLAEATGRFGIDRPIAIPPEDVTRLAEGLSPGAAILVLGTGEFMHVAFRVGHALEALGFRIAVQSTSRSPILIGADVERRLVFADNYGEGIRNYLYNVDPSAYARIILCHETPRDGLEELLRQLGPQCLTYRYPQSESASLDALSAPSP